MPPRPRQSPGPAPAKAPPSWNTPERFSPTANSSHAMPATKAGDWNWKPHPTAAPASRKPSSAAPSAAKVRTTPAA